MSNQSVIEYQYQICIAQFLWNSNGSFPATFCGSYFSLSLSTWSPCSGTSNRQLYPTKNCWCTCWSTCQLNISTMIRNLNNGESLLFNDFKMSPAEMPLLRPIPVLSLGMKRVHPTIAVHWNSNLHCKCSNCKSPQASFSAKRKKNSRCHWWCGSPQGSWIKKKNVRTVIACSY